MKRVFIIVLDSLGIGEMSDAFKFGDEGSNTLKSLYMSGRLNVPTLAGLGLFNIDGIDYTEGAAMPSAAFARMTEVSSGKDTTVGHWEIAGHISTKPFPVYPDGFPDEIISAFEKQTGKKVLCNKPYSGTEVIFDYGREHEKTGALIVYTSGDSVFQIAAHESTVPVEELYKYCAVARNILVGEHAVARVIARPFVGEYPAYKRTTNRHDFSFAPPSDTMLDILKRNNKDVISVGKIYDIFAGKGITEKIVTGTNDIGMQKTFEVLKRNFDGLCFVNLVDFDSLYGHRNDVDGYTNALNAFDAWLSVFLSEMHDDDVLMITGDHGCDPLTVSTDHSREYTPLIVFGKKIKPVDLGTRSSFADIGKTVLDIFDISGGISGESFYMRVKGE